MTLVLWARPVPPTEAASVRAVRSGPKGLGQSLAEIARRRALLAALVSREVRERYVGTSLGMLWLLIQPALLIAFYTFIFSVVFKVRTGFDAGRLSGTSGHGSYAMFLMGGLIPWVAFSEALSRSARSIIANRSIITKVVFPVELLPISSVLAAQAGFLGMFSVVVVIALFTGALSWTILAAIPLMLILALLSLGLGYFLAVISTFFRDVSNLLPFALNLWLYATPILYARTALPEPLQPWMTLNPVAPLVEAFRWCLIGGPAPSLGALAYGTAFAIVSFLLGFWLFRRGQVLFSEVL